MSSSSRKYFFYLRDDYRFFFSRFDFKWSNEENHVSKTNTTCEYIYETRSVGGKKQLFTYEKKNICLIFILYNMNNSIFGMIICICAHTRNILHCEKRHNQVQNFHIRMATNRKMMIVCMSVSLVNRIDEYVCEKDIRVRLQG
jgi:hypothetical protein